jgi:hypothetical protein
VISNGKQGQDRYARSDVAARLDGQEIAICRRCERHTKLPRRDTRLETLANTDEDDSERDEDREPSGQPFGRL